MELRHLRYFRVVAEELHFGRAAARLHMEPQPLNFQIKQLERELGFALLTRRENRTHLTAAGSAFLADAEAILAAADRAVDRAALIARGEAGLLRVAYSGPLLHWLLVPGMKRFREAYPEVSFDLKTLLPQEQEGALNDHGLDLGFTLFSRTYDFFAARTIARVAQVVAVPAGDRLAAARHVAWHDLDGRDAIALNHHPLFHQQMTAVLAEHGVAVKTTRHADDADAALALVGLGVGLTFLPSFAARAPNDDVAFVGLPADAPLLDFSAIWRADDDHPLRERFVEALADVAQEICTTTKVSAART